MKKQLQVDMYEAKEVEERDTLEALEEEIKEYRKK